MSTQPVTPTPAAPVTPTFTVNPAANLAPVYVVSAFNSGGYQINPWYCATPEAAQRFINYVKAKLGLVATMSWDWPTWPQGAGPFAQSGKVPYVDFTAAVNPLNNHMNAGGVFVEYFEFNNAAADQALQQWLAAE